MVFRGANKQKHVFKKNPKAPIWGKPPKVIGGKLLASGYWDAMAQEQQHGVEHRQPRQFDVDDLVNNVSQVVADNISPK